MEKQGLLQVVKRSLCIGKSSYDQNARDERCCESDVHFNLSCP
jgi:hypothetical protein